jgi:hypothetical protein
MDYAAKSIDKYYRRYMREVWEGVEGEATTAGADANTSAAPCFLSYAFLPSTGVVIATPSRLNFDPFDPASQSGRQRPLPVRTYHDETTGKTSILYLLATDPVLNWLNHQLQTNNCLNINTQSPLPPRLQASRESLSASFTDTILLPNTLHSSNAPLIPLSCIELVVSDTHTSFIYVPIGGGMYEANTDDRAPAKPVVGSFPSRSVNDDDCISNRGLINKLGMQPGVKYDVTLASHRVKEGRCFKVWRNVIGDVDNITELIENEIYH